MWNRKFLQILRIVNALQYVPTKIRVANFSKKMTTVLKGLVIRVGIDLPKVIVHVNQAATICFGERKDGDKSVANTVRTVQREKVRRRSDGEAQINRDRR